MAISRLLLLRLFVDSPAIRRIASVVQANFYTFISHEVIKWRCSTFLTLQTSDYFLKLT